MAITTGGQPALIGEEYSPVYANLIRTGSTLPPPGQGDAVVHRVIIAETVPLAASQRREGQLWWQPSANGRMFIFVAGAWAQLW